MEWLDYESWTPERVLQPGEVACMKAMVKLSWDQPGPFVVLEADFQMKETGVELVPEIVATETKEESWLVFRTSPVN